MELSFDAEHNVAYLRLGGTGDPGTTYRSVTLLDTPVGIDIVMDFDEDDRLIGLEFLAASQQLRGSVLDLA